MSFTNEQIQQFKSKGFIVLKGLFDAAEVERLSSCFDTLQENPGGKELNGKYFETSPITGDNLLVRIENIIGDHNAELSEILLSAKATESLTQLFGEPPVLFKDKINYKLPGCRSDLLHQDQAAGWGKYCSLFITMVVAVDENRSENAAMTILGTGEYDRTLTGDEWQPMEETDSLYSLGEDYHILELDPGDAVFFDSFVPHGSPANTSDKTRRNVFLTFNGKSEGDARSQYYRDKWVNYAANEGGEARTGDSFLV